MPWPKSVKDRIKTGTDRELVHSYPYRSACPSSVWGELIGGSSQDLLFAGYTNYFLWLDQPDFVGTLRRKAEQGCRVRFLLGDPEAEVTRQREQLEDVELTVSTRIRITLEHLRKLGTADGVEARFSAPTDAVNHISLSVFRFDDQLLVTPHLARLVGHDSPLLHLRRHGNGGMFSRFTEHAEELWGRGGTRTGFGQPLIIRNA
ncbi:DNA-binding protein [Streptomyces griseocarneus]|nr:DNA-binding protein [Streptomyces griseocarneus]